MSLSFKPVTNQPPINLLSNPAWPKDFQTLFDEATGCFTIGAFMAAGMVVRKIITIIACDNGAAEGAPFAEHVDHITNVVIPMQEARESIRWLKTVNNNAYRVRFLSRTEALLSIKVARYVLNVVHAIPTA